MSPTVSEQELKNPTPPHLGSFRGIEAEARAKVQEMNKDLRATFSSLTFESASNAAFLGAAIALNLPELERAAVGALLVYFPLAYEWGNAFTTKRTLLNRVSAYVDTHDTQVFDDIGLSFRGNRPLLDGNVHEPFIKISEIFDPLCVWDKNKNWGIVGSAGIALKYNAMAAGSFGWQTLQGAGRSLKRAFNMRVKPEQARDFAYGQDPCDHKKTTVISTVLPEINNSAAVVMPADPKRLKASYDFTVRNTRPDYLKMGLNWVGAFGAGEFCFAVGSDIAPRISQAVQNQDMGSAAVAGVWAFTTLVGMGPLKHFLDDNKRVYKDLRAKWEIIRAKRDAMNALTKTYDSINALVDDGINRRRERNDTEYERNLRTLTLGYHLKRIDHKALSPKIMDFLEHEGLVSPNLNSGQDRTQPLPPMV